MRATATPPGSTGRPIEITSPEWVETERGGLSSLTFSCDLSDAERAELVYGTIIELPLPDRAPLIARVLEAGNPTITCGGGQSLFDDILGGATYSVSRLEPWGEWTRDDRATNIGVTIESKQIRFVWEGGTVYAAGAKNGVVLVLDGPSDSVTVSLPWTRPSTDFAMNVFTGVRGGVDSDPWSWTTQTSVAAGSGALTGTIAATYSGTAIGAVLVTFNDFYAVTPSAATACFIKNPRVYGTALTTVTPSTVASNLFTRAGITSQDVATIADDLTDIAWGLDERGQDLATDLLDRGDWLMRVEPRPDVTGYGLCGVLEPRPATADEVIYCDGRDVIESLEAIGAKLTGVRVMYGTVSGAPSYVDVPSAEPPIVPRWDVTSCDTTSASVATAYGTSYLQMKSSGVRGTVLVKKRYNLVPGHRYTFTHTRLGTVTARARQLNVKMEGTTVALDDTDTFEAWVLRGGATTQTVSGGKTLRQTVRDLHRKAIAARKG